MSSEREVPKGFGRRELLRFAGGSTIVAVGLGLGKAVLQPFASGTVDAVGTDPHMAKITPDHYMFLGGTDGWIGLPPTPAIPPFHPGPVRGRQGPQRFAAHHLHLRFPQHHRAQRRHADQPEEPCAAQRTAVLGEAVHAPATPRPQREFGSTSPTSVSPSGPTCSMRTPCTGTASATSSRSSTASPPARCRCRPAPCSPTCTAPYDPGTYMYHCHVEDVEHVHMGMNGLVFVRPVQNGNTDRCTRAASTLYNDGDGSPATTVSTPCTSARCGPRPTGPTPTSSCRSGATTTPTSACSTAVSIPTRSPRTLPLATDGPRPAVDQAVHAGQDHRRPGGPEDGAPDVNVGYEHLQYQPLSSLIECNAGERVLLRFSNLGFKEPAMTIDGITMRVVGRDATPMWMRHGRDGTDTSYETNTISFGAGESFDVIIEAPPTAATPARVAGTTPTCSTTGTSPATDNQARRSTVDRPPRSTSTRTA